MVARQFEKRGCNIKIEEKNNNNKKATETHSLDLKLEGW